jgi:hypothetical protein
MRVIFTILLVGLFTNISFADEQRLTTLFKSESGKYSLKYSKKKWRLLNETGKVLYSIIDKNYISMTIFVSNDGQRLVVIDDFMEGHQIKERPALIFFKDGIKTATYKLKDILNDTCNVRQSIWHTIWSLEDFGFKKTDSLFSLATFEFNEFEFNTFNGTLLKKNKPKPFDEKTFIVYGKFYKGDNSETTMTILKYIAGPKMPENKITFKTKSFGKGSWTQTIMIKDGIEVTPARFRVSIGYSCLEN